MADEYQPQSSPTISGPLPGFDPGVAAFCDLVSLIRGTAMEAVSNATMNELSAFQSAHESWLVNWLSLLRPSWDDPIYTALPRFDLSKNEDRDRLFYLEDDLRSICSIEGRAKIDPSSPFPKIARLTSDLSSRLDMGALYGFFSNFNEYVNGVGYDWSSDEHCTQYNRFIYLLYGLLQYLPRGNYSRNPIAPGSLERRRAFYMAHFLGTTEAPSSLSIPKGIREGCSFTKHVMEAFDSIDLFMSALVNGEKVAATQADFEEFMLSTFIPLSIAFNAAYIFDFEMDSDDDSGSGFGSSPIIWAAPYALVTTKPNPEWGCDESTYQERRAMSEAIFPREERQEKPNALKRLRSEISKPRPVDRRSAWEEEASLNRFIEESKRMEVKVNTKFAAMLDEERQRAAAKQLREAVESPKHPEVINSKAVALLEAISISTTTSSSNLSAMGDGASSDVTSEGGGGLLSPVSTTASTLVSPRPPRKIPNILRRRDTNVNKPGSSPYLFHFGEEKEEIYNRPVVTIRTKNGYKPYVVMKVVNELPDLLRKPRNKANFMGVSTNKFFERSVSDMDQRYKNQLYFTTISFCEEMAAIPLMDNEARMEVMGRYYGVRREDEPLDNYYHNFRKDVWDSIAMYYAFYSYL